MLQSEYYVVERFAEHMVWWSNYKTLFLVFQNEKKNQTPIISNNTLIFHKMSSFITHAYMLYEYKIKQVEI